jgi:hypothetical protein
MHACTDTHTRSLGPGAGQTASPPPRCRRIFSTPSVSFYLSLDSVKLHCPATNKKKRRNGGSTILLLVRRHCLFCTVLTLCVVVVVVVVALCSLHSRGRHTARHLLRLSIARQHREPPAFCRSSLHSFCFVSVLAKLSMHFFYKKSPCAFVAEIDGYIPPAAS